MVTAVVCVFRMAGGVGSLFSVYYVRL